MHKAFAFSHLLIVAVLLCATAASTSAQGIGKLLETLTGSRSTTPEKQHPPPEEQLVYAKEQLAAAEKQKEEFAAPEFVATLRASGVPQLLHKEFQDIVTEIVQTWGLSVSILEGVILEAQIAASSGNSEIAAPRTPEEAAKLEARLQAARAASANALKERDLLNREQASNANLCSAYEAALEAANEALATATDADKPALSIQARLAQLRLDLANARAFYFAWALYRAETEQRKSDAEALALSRALDESPYNKLLDPRRLSQQKLASERAQPALAERLKKAIDAHSKASEALKQLQEKSGLKKDDKGGADSKANEQLRTAMDIVRRRETIRLGAQLLLEINAMQQKEWATLLEAVHQNTIDAWRAAKALIESDIRQIEIYRPRVDARITEIRSNLDSIDRELQAPGMAGARKTTAERLRDTVRDQLEIFLELQTSLASLRSTQDRILLEVESRIAEKSIGEKLVLQWSRASQAFNTFWNYPLTITDGHPVTAGKIILGALGFATALYFARRLALRLRRVLVGRFHFQEGQAHAVQVLLFYILAIAFFFTTLHWLNIPLTVFAFLGGALMVGIGFGSQNLMNNFISGLIILLERNVNVGDLVEVDGHVGRIISLGARCSTLRKFDGVEVLIPNSSLLEKNVINWTLSDPNHRFDFLVGVAYGTDLQKAQRLFLQAMTEQPEVLKDPAPTALLESFGDSAIIFHLYFWMRIGVGNAPEIGSRIRFRIYALCRENEIEIPFPQRDIHIRSLPQTKDPSPNKIF